MTLNKRTLNSSFGTLFLIFIIAIMFMPSASAQQFVGAEGCGCVDYINTTTVDVYARNSNFKIDSKGNIYYFGSSSNCDFSSLSFPVTTNNSYFILLKFDSQMNLVWSKDFSQINRGGFIDVDENDNLYVGYTFTDKSITNDVGLNGNVEILDTSVESAIVKYSPNQDSILWKIEWDDIDIPSNNYWAQGLRLINASIDGNQMAVILNGNTSGDYHPGTPYEYFPSHLFPSSSTYVRYIMTIDLTNGHIDSYRRLYGGADFLPTISDGIIALKYYKNNDYDIFDGTTFIGNSSSEKQGLYILDSSLQVINRYFTPYLYFSLIPGPGKTWYGIGSFQGTIDFNPKAGNLFIASDSTISADREDVFVSQFDTTGVPIWIRRFGGKARDFGFDISRYRKNDLLIAGMYITETQFDTSSSSTLTPEGLHDGFMIRLDGSGNYISGKSIGGTDSDYIYRISGNQNGQVATMGYYTNQMDADPDSSSNYILTASSIIAPGYFAPFIATYCDTTHSTLSVTGCGGFYTSPSGKVWTVTGTYADTVANAFGCDSLMTIHLTAVNAPFSTTIVLNGATFSTSTQADTYQWIDCTTGQEIQGADSSHFTATSNGTYALIMEVDGCVDTSACMSINNIGLGEFEVLKYSIYPNPTDGLVSIKGYEQESFPLFVTVLDLSGREIYHDEIEKQTLNLSHLKSGVYVLSVKDASGHSEVHRLVIN